MHLPCDGCPTGSGGEKEAGAPCNPPGPATLLPSEKYEYLARHAARPPSAPARVVLVRRKNGLHVNRYSENKPRRCAPSGRNSGPAQSSVYTVPRRSRWWRETRERRRPRGRVGEGRWREKVQPREVIGGRGGHWSSCCSEKGTERGSSC